MKTHNQDERHREEGGRGTAEDVAKAADTQSSGFTWFVYLKPESLFRPAYKIWGATPVLPSVFLCHVGQFQLSVGLSVFTDNTLRRENREAQWGL